MMINKFISLALISILGLACTNKNRNLFVPEEPKLAEKVTTGSATDHGQIIVHEPNRDVDILFIIDQSASMAAIIKEVHENIDRFVNEFTSDDKNKVNFRIGVTTAWDSEHFEKKLPQQWLTNKNEYSQNSDIWPNLNYKLKQGKLQPNKFNGKTILQAPPYITAKTPNLVETLRETLKVNAEIYKYELDNDQNELRNVYELTQNSPFLKNSAGQSLYGPSPENEEFFTTIRQMIDPNNIKLRERINQGFPSPNANQLAVFIITDADDDTRNRHNISAQDIYEELKSFMGNDASKLAVYGALYESGRSHCQVRKLNKNGEFETEPEFLTSNDPTFIGGPPGIDRIKNPKFVDGEISYKYSHKKRDPGLKGSYNAPEKIEELVKMSGGQIKSICSTDFGAELAAVGFNIREKTLEQKDILIDLKAAYDLNTIKVLYGGQEIPYSTKKGWSIDILSKTSTKINISKDAYIYDENKKFEVYFDKMTDTNIRSNTPQSH